MFRTLRHSKYKYKILSRCCLDIFFFFDIKKFSRVCRENCICTFVIGRMTKKNMRVKKKKKVKTKETASTGLYKVSGSLLLFFANCYFVHFFALFFRWFVLSSLFCEKVCYSFRSMPKGIFVVDQLRWRFPFDWFVYFKGLEFIFTD